MPRALILIAIALTLGACADRVNVPTVGGNPDVTRTQGIFVVTNRKVNEHGNFNDQRSTDLSYMRTNISIPETHERGVLKVNYRNPNPKKHFAVVGQRRLSESGQLSREIRSSLNQLPAKDREITLFIHGYFNTYTDTVLRTGQIREDLRLGGETVAFAWPSAGRALGYTYDRESVLFSRDDLETVIRQLAKVRAERLVLVAHSMGSLLLMETIRQIEQSQPGWSAANIDAVFLIAPDIAVDLFKQQLTHIKTLPDPFFIVTSDNDKALQLSKRVNNNTPRLGRKVGAAELSDFPVILIDLTQITPDSGETHFAGFGGAGVGAIAQDIRMTDAIMAHGSDNPLTGLAGTVVQAERATEYHLTPPYLTDYGQ